MMDLCLYVTTLWVGLNIIATTYTKESLRSNSEEIYLDHEVEEIFKGFSKEETVLLETPYFDQGRQKRDTETNNVKTLLIKVKGHTVTFVTDSNEAPHAYLPNTLIEENMENVTEVTFLHTECLVTGYVLGLKASAGTINICHRMTGVLGTEYGDFYIAPKPYATSKNEYRMWKEESSVGKLQPQSDQDAPAESSTKYFQPNGEKRQKRQAGKEHYLEVLLVTDRNLVKYHGEDLYQQYLLTQMELVNKMYRHPSLGVTINVVVKKLLVIDMRTSRRLVVEGNAVVSLDRFCTWVRTESMRQHNHNGRHDIALYITREDIGPAGYAHVTGLCNPRRSCTVIKDEGISSAFIIGHEMAHVFGIRHEGVRNRCVDDPTDGRMMASRVESTYYNFYWSICSREMMAQYLPRLWCLNNIPTDPGWTRIPEPYGISWGLDEQCKGEFTEKHTFCKFFLTKNPCEKLWCALVDEPFRCVTKHAPPLPGTSCGQGKWCQKEECVESEHLGGAAGWTQWSTWGLCSRTCGTGVQFRQRMCNKGRSQNTEVVCPGPEDDYRLCNKQPCPGGPADYRAQQCQEFNNIDIDGKNSWLPYESDNATGYCKLTCISEETRDILVTESEVVDGTFCSYELPDHICIKGKCKRIGCDGKINSTKSEDLCGVCGGDNTSCKKFSVVVSETLRRRGYFRLVHLPVGTRNLAVEERYNRGVSIVLKDVASNDVLLNSESDTKQSREFIQYGARFVYHRGHSTQTLKARGPLNGDMMLMIYSAQEGTPTYITYDYSIPEDLKESDAARTQPLFKLDEYGWEDKGWSECSVTCGPGVQKTVHVCIRKESQEQVKPAFCSPSDEPAAQTKPCNKRRCRYYEWETQEWSKCSATCGRTGLQQRYIRCLYYDNEKVRPANYRYCDPGERPEYTRPCNREACVLDWSVGPWTQCSVTCGTGRQIRAVACPIPRPDEPGGGDLFECQGEKPEATKQCVLPPCPVTTTPSPTTTSPTPTTREPSTRRPTRPRVRPCRGDVSKAICRFGARSNTCRLPLYQRLCCETCVALLLKT